MNVRLSLSQDMFPGVLVQNVLFGHRVDETSPFRKSLDDGYAGTGYGW